MCPHMILQGPGRAKAPSGRTVVASQLESTSHGRTSRWPDQRLRPRLDAGCAPESLVEGGHRRLRLARSLAPRVPPITISRTVAALAWLAACFVSGRRVRGGKGTGSSGGRRLRIGRDGVGVAAGAAVAVVVGSAGIPTANGSRVRLRSPRAGLHHLVEPRPESSRHYGVTQPTGGARRQVSRLGAGLFALLTLILGGAVTPVTEYLLTGFAAEASRAAVWFVPRRRSTQLLTA